MSKINIIGNIHMLADTGTFNADADHLVGGLKFNHYRRHPSGASYWRYEAWCGQPETFTLKNGVKVTQRFWGSGYDLPLMSVEGDEEVIRQLKAGGTDAEVVLGRLARNYWVVARCEWYLYGYNEHCCYWRLHVVRESAIGKVA